MWVSFIEKAYAKLHGGYQNLCSGSIAYALRDLTNGVTDVIDLDVSEGPDYHSELLNKLRQAKGEGWLMGVVFNPEAPKAKSERLQEQGILHGHCYPVLDVRQIPGGQWMLRMRNPWGVVHWCGPWSANSTQWTPEIEYHLDHKPSPEDGTFWMSFDTFQKGVSQVYICRLYHNPPTKDSLWCMALDEGKWVGPGACGANCLQGVQYAVTSAKTTSVFIWLEQNDHMWKEKEKNCISYGDNFIGFWVLKGPEAVDEDHLPNSDHVYWDQLAIPPITYVGSRGVGKELKLEAGMKYVIAPTQLLPGVEAHYILRVYAPTAVRFRKLEPGDIPSDWNDSRTLNYTAPAVHLEDLKYDLSFRGQCFEPAYDPQLGGEKGELQIVNAMRYTKKTHGVRQRGPRHSKSVVASAQGRG
jgi:hypothetical protein